jgi:inward rectifier potassium channel
MIARTPVSDEPSNHLRTTIGNREVILHGIVRAVLPDLYHYFMTVSWPKLFAAIATLFLVFDFLFGCLYDLQPHSIANLDPPGFAGTFFLALRR